MKKILLLMLALTLSISLVACNKMPDIIYDEVPSFDIKPLLGEVLNDVQPGTAGCSLKAIIVATDFMNSYSDAVDDEKGFNDFKLYYMELSDNEKAIFDEAWEMVYNEIINLTGSDRPEAVAEALETAGKSEDNHYPWTEDAIKLYEDINSIVND